MARRHTVVGEPDIRVAHAAAGNLDHNIVRTGLQNREFAGLQGRVGSRQSKSIPTIRACHLGPRYLYFYFFSLKLEKLLNSTRLGGDEGHNAVQWTHGRTLTLNTRWIIFEASA